MKLNHIGLTVTDPVAAGEFLQKYFDMKPMGKPHRRMTHVRDDDGLILSLFAGETITTPETTHIGFIQESEEKVNEMWRRLKEDGFDVPPPERAHGWTFTFVAPGGFAIEVVA